MNNLNRGIATHSYRHIILHFLIALSLVFACPLFAKAEECSSSIGDYISIPPFLSSGVEANLLLMLDNSGSMYDLAYVDDQKYCYDDNYITYTPPPPSTSGYAGYFDRGIWYYYNQTTEQFELRTGDWPLLSLSSEWTGAAGTGYDHDDVHIKVNSGKVTAFFAKGNFLNWATASKLDIQKKILTGGKYEETGTYGAPNDRLVMESRGCLESHFVKQVQVTPAGGGNLHYLILGIRSPQEAIFPPWTNGSDYPADYVVNYYGELYRTKNVVTASSTPPDQDTANWALYTHVIRWTSGTFYSANSIVSYEGKMYITDTDGTESVPGVAGGDWVSYNVTHIEIFPVTETGFANGDCELAIQEMGKKSPNQGLLKQYIDGCMGYQSGGGQSEEADSHGAFNHSIHNCWYLAKNGSWPPGAGPTESVMNDCEHIYDTWGTDPWVITPYDRGYVCSGLWNDNSTAPIGYVGRCWHPGANATLVCTKYKKDGTCQKEEWIGGINPGWDLAGAGYASVDECIETALRDYCGYLKIPEVIDPSDQASETGEFWNIPAVLIDSGLAAQQGEPMAVFKGYIKQDGVPTGLIQEFADDLRIGAMIFNDYGSKTECNDPVVDSHILSHCIKGNRDGGKIISYIDDGAAPAEEGEGNHTTELVLKINDIKATCWTPIAEAMYTAIGYYTQNAALRLDPGDFLMDDNHTDPVQLWCQYKNVLIITEGASTADLNLEVINFVKQAGQNDGDDVDLADCGSLDGSTSLDDLTYYAKHGDILNEKVPSDEDEDKYKITTHIVVAGTLRSSGVDDDECSPDVLLSNAALNGGTSLLQAADPSELEHKLRIVFGAIRKGAAAGSAASVISASRAGEGVIYQAIFFPKDYGQPGQIVNWSGEVHALFVDAYGNMREDTDGNHALDLDTDRIVEFNGNNSTAELYDYNSTTETKTSAGNVIITNIKFIWDTTSWLSDITNTDVLSQREYDSTDHKRYIFTDKIDTTKPVSIDNVYNTDVMDFTPGFVAANDNYYFLNPANPEIGLTEEQMITEAQNIICFVRGEEGLSETGTGTPYRNRTLNIDGNDRVYRLGDIIHSTPTVVSQPSEDYDLLYRDDSYRAFRKKYLNRRIVVYAGANDGMLHAFNGGFYDASAHKFYTQPPFNDLGSELWAYVPNALLPHLKWLKEPLDDNTHVYYVDLKPRIFDARIFSDDLDHPGGWGTVLIGGMRFGGSPIGVDTDGDGDCDLNFRSTYFALDITNPEEPPSLLWSFSDDNLGFTTSYPTPIRVGSKWFIVIGSGPDNYDAVRGDVGDTFYYGGSNRAASLYILNADDGTLAKEFSMDGHSFMAAPIAVDFDLLATTTEDNATLWTGEAIYVASDGCGA